LKDGSITNQVPYDMNDIVGQNIKSFEGWKQNLLEKGAYSALPSEFTDYISFVENYLETPVAMVSLGPGRNQNIEKSTIFA